MTKNGNYVFGLCATSFTEERYLLFVEALTREVSRVHSKLLVFTCFHELSIKDSHDQGEKSIFQIVSFEKLDALVILTESFKDLEVPKQLARNAMESGIPVFSIDSSLDGCYNINYGYADAFSSLVRHLIQHHKCRRLNLIAGIKDNPFEIERTNQFRVVLEEFGIPVEEDRIGYGGFWSQPTYVVIDEFMRKGLPMPDAIVCENDSMAIATCERLREYGYEVPSDILVTGLDGTEQGQNHTPTLTTATQDQKEAARKVVSVFLDLVNGLCPEKATVIPFREHYSQSCGCVPITVTDANTVLSRLEDRWDEAINYDDFLDGMRHNVIRSRFRDLLPRLEPYFLDISWLCLRSDFSSTLETSIEYGKYDDNVFAFTPQMNAVLSHCEDNTFYNRFFSISELLPNFDSELAKHSGFAFFPLHFQETVFGYYAVSLDAYAFSYDKERRFTNNLSTILQVVQEQERVYTLNRQLEVTNQKLTDLYNLDPLTGLLNRRGFYDYMKNTQNGIRLTNSQLVLLSVDMDGLKKINDTYGHIEGDSCICLISDCLKHLCRKYEPLTCARFGGDEFILAGFFDYYATVADDIIESFNAQMAFLNQISHKDYEVCASVGYVDIRPEIGFELEDAINEADSLMYVQKQKRKKERLVKASSHENIDDRLL